MWRCTRYSHQTTETVAKARRSKMTNLTPVQIIIVGATIVFGVPIAVGIVVGYFFGFWLGVLVGGLIFVGVLMLGHRRLTEMKRDKEDRHIPKEDNGQDKTD